MPFEDRSTMHPVRGRVTDALTMVEDIVYAGLGVLLSVTALYLLFVGLKTFVTALLAHTLSTQTIALLDQFLAILLIIELLYTVQVSFAHHGLVAEPFIVVTLIAVIRRVLVLTAELPQLSVAGNDAFRHAIMELSLLTLMIIVLVGSLILLQRHVSSSRAA